MQTIDSNMDVPQVVIRKSRKGKKPAVPFPIATDGNITPGVIMDDSGGEDSSVVVMLRAALDKNKDKGKRIELLSCESKDESSSESEKTSSPTSNSPKGKMGSPASHETKVTPPKVKRVVRWHDVVSSDKKYDGGDEYLTESYGMNDECGASTSSKTTRCQTPPRSPQAAPLSPVSV